MGAPARALRRAADNSEQTASKVALVMHLLRSGWQLHPLLGDPCVEGGDRLISIPMFGRTRSTVFELVLTMFELISSKSDLGSTKFGLT